MLGIGIIFNYSIIECIFRFGNGISSMCAGVLSAAAMVLPGGLIEGVTIVGSAAAATGPNPVAIGIGIALGAVVSVATVAGLIYKLANPPPLTPFQIQRRNEAGATELVDVSYRLERQLGKGPFSTVSLGRNGRDRVAIKEIELNENTRKMIMHEIECHSALSHQFIVGFRGHMTRTSHYILFIDYVSGGTVSDAISKNPSWFKSKEAKAKIICGIALAMKFIHSKNIVHRDLKPQNVLLDDDHLPKICDFGSSCFFQRIDDDVTMSTHPPVTYCYEAPELYNEDGKYTNKMDVYSFGVMLYEIITGNFAFRSDMHTVNELRVAGFIALGKRPTIPDNTTEFARRLINQCWAEDPDDRPSFEEICDMLHGNCGHLFPGQDPKKMNSFITKYWK